MPKCAQDAFFQPYLPLQQLDLIKSQTSSFLCGSTNAIVRQQKDVDEIVKDVNDTWDTEDAGMRWVYVFLECLVFVARRE